MAFAVFAACRVGGKLTLIELAIVEINTVTLLWIFRQASQRRIPFRPTLLFPSETT
jgi:hypothetical protein